MDNRRTRTRLRTPVLVDVLAVIAGSLGAGFNAIIGAMFVGLLGMGDTLAYLSGAIWAIAGAAIGSSTVGLVGLAFGARLGPRFSYPLLMCLGSSYGMLCCLATDIGSNTREKFPLAMLFAGAAVLVSAISAFYLANATSGYGAMSRRWGAVAALVSLPVGLAGLHLTIGIDTLLESFDAGEWGLWVVPVLMFIIPGAAFGAILGASFKQCSLRAALVALTVFAVLAGTLG